MNEDKYEYLPYNGQEGQPCPHGCIMKKNKETDKLYLVGDCRIPYDKDCCMNKLRLLYEQIKGSLA